MQHKRKKFLSLLLMLSAVFGLLACFAEGAHASDSVSYMEASYTAENGVTYTEKTADATAITSSTTSLSDGGWYYVSGTVTNSNRITVRRTANLILCDGATLNATAGINVASGNTLNIYGQTNGTGKLTANGSSANAGIGGDSNNAGGTVSIHGGTVTATGGYNGGAGIGGGSNGGSGGTVTIYGGTVTANGGRDYTQGIGHGYTLNAGNSGSLTVGSGLVVYGGSTADPTTVIPSPYSSRPQYMKVAPFSLPPVSYVEMSFDAVTSQATSAEKSTNDYTLVSPDITAWSNDAWYVVSGSVQVSSVTVTGSANLILRDGATLTASGGITLANSNTLKVYAQSGGTGSLAVTGSIGSGGTLTIHGGNISATGGSGAAAIAGSSVDVYGGNVTADGGSSASGITGTITVSSTLRVFGGSTTSTINVLTDYSTNRPRYMRVATPHATHSLSNYQLSTDGMTITAVCANSDHLCGLPNATATLTILAPTAGESAASLSGDVDEFGVSASNILYAQRSGGTWGSESSTVPTGSGFFRASITVGGKTASVTYGVSAITVKSGIENGTVTAPTVATVSVEVPLTISPATGYELDTLTVSTDSGKFLTVITGSDGSKSFIMPNEEVSVNATFKMTDYTIYFNVTSASITVPATAHYGDTVRVVISPDAGYGVLSFGIDGVSDLTLVSKDTDSGVEVYTFTMPYQNISLDITFAETTIYTIFYKAGDSVNSIAYRFSSADISFDMMADAKADSVACWAGQMRGAVGRASFPISFNVNNAGWGAFTNCEVVDNLDNFSSLTDGTAILIAGDENAFIAAFKWGYFYTDENGERKVRSDYGVKNFFVTGNTTSVTITNPTWTGYTFAGWSYTDKDGEEQTITPGASNTTVAINGNIDKTTVFGAIWQINQSTVSYDLNGGSWSNAGTTSVAYKSTLTQPTDPTRDGYAFDGWTVKSSTRAMKNYQAVTLAAGSKFDFDTTQLTADITLQAAWKHVHSYVYIPLSKINNVIPNALSQSNIDKYGPYMHFVLCSHGDDHYFEAHKFNKNGKCVCGATKPTTTVTLEETYGNRDAGLIFTSNPAKNSEVILSAPLKGTDQFVKWEYRSLNGSTWYDLAAAPVVGFIIPGSMRVNAVYESLSEPQLTLQASHYGDDGLLFTMQYMLPKGWKATNAAVVYGDNHMLRYMEVVRASSSAFSTQLTDPWLGIPIPGTEVEIGKKEQTYYYDREDNILDIADNKSALRQKMLNGEAVNIPGYNEAGSKKAQSLGQTSGYAYGGLTQVKNANSGNRYIYGLGLVEYTDANNAEHMAVVGPIAVTYNSTSSAVTDTDIYIYNYTED